MDLSKLHTPTDTYRRRRTARAMVERAGDLVQSASSAHNPKVAGSNPAPATNCSTKAQVRDLGLRRSLSFLPGQAAR
jgi:hypothetical protein